MKLINGKEIITVENPKDFYGETKKDFFVIVTHDLTFLLNPSNKEYRSCWLDKEELDRAIKNARKWTLIDSIKLSLKRTFLKVILNEKEQDDFQYNLN